MNGHRCRIALSAALIATLALLGAGCAQGPAGRGTGPSSTPYKGDEPWKISSIDPFVGDRDVPTTGIA